MDYALHRKLFEFCPKEKGLMFEEAYREIYLELMKVRKELSDLKTKNKLLGYTRL